MGVKNSFRQVVILLLLFLSTPFVQAEIVVIANHEVPDKRLTPQQVKAIFLGKSHSLPSGTKITPVDQEVGEPPRDEFYLKVAKKNAYQLASYWSPLIFTGKELPPQKLIDDNEVKSYIVSNPDTIGYISASNLDSSVKVLLRVP